MPPYGEGRLQGNARTEVYKRRILFMLGNRCFRSLDEYEEEVARLSIINALMGPINTQRGNIRPSLDMLIPGIRWCKS